MGFFQKPFKLFAIDADTGQPLNPNVRRKTYVKYYDVKTNGASSKIFVAHKAPSDAEKRVTFKTEDVKEKKNNKGNCDGNDKGQNNGKDGGQQQEQKSADVPWTVEEDETLRSMKAENKSWAVIAEEIGRVKSQCQHRFKEIGQAREGVEKGDENTENKKNKQQNQGGGKKGKGGKGGEENLSLIHI